jgi:hypothetical protein
VSETEKFPGIFFTDVLFPSTFRKQGRMPAFLPAHPSLVASLTGFIKTSANRNLSLAMRRLFE